MTGDDMNAFGDLVEADRRLVILRCLNEDPGYSLNESVLESMLDALGHNVSRDRIRTDLGWLREQGLVEINEVVNVQVAKVTCRGIDVATGKATVPGIKRPRPGQ